MIVFNSILAVLFCAFLGLTCFLCGYFLAEIRAGRSEQQFLRQLRNPTEPRE